MSEKKGAVIYEIRADDSNVEKDLDAANKKVEKSERKAAERSEKTEKETGEAKKQVKEDVTRHHQKQNAEQEKSDEDSAKNREKTAEAHGEKLKAISSATTKAIGVGMLAAGTAILGIGTAAVSSATSMDQAMNQFIASTGKGTEETERYQKVLENIYTNNYGEDFQDIAAAMEQVNKQLGNMSDEELQQITESAFALRDTFEYEITESTRAAKAMVDNFGVSGEEAMNLIAAGAQNGLDYSGELLDSISEYSVQFAKIGLDADDMFQIFQKGAETGAWNLDKIGDAVKEMSIRVIDGSETTRAGFEGIGLDADRMAAKFSEGGESAKEAFQETIASLAGIEDPLAQNAAGVALFGTMWEDLGPEVVTALADIGDAAYATGDELNSIKDVKYNDLSSMLEGLKRSVEMLLLPLGEKLIPLLSEVITAILPVIEQLLPPLIDAVGQAIEQLMPLVEEILPVLMDLINQLIPPLLDIIGAILPVIVELFKALLPPIIEIISAVLPVLIELINAILPIFQVLIDLLLPIIDLFMALLLPILDLISLALVPLIDFIVNVVDTITDYLIPVIEWLEQVFTVAFSVIFEVVKSTIGKMKEQFSLIIDFFKNVFAGDWGAAWDCIKALFKNVAESMPDIFKKPINFIIGMINKFIDGINGIKIPDWVPGVGGLSFQLPRIPQLRIGMRYVPEDDFPALLHKGEAVLTAKQNYALQSLGGIDAVLNGNMDSKNTDVSVTVDIDYDKLAKAVAANATDVTVQLVPNAKGLFDLIVTENKKEITRTGRGI